MISRRLPGALALASALAALPTAALPADEALDPGLEQAGASDELEESLLQIGEATPMTRREPTLPALSVELDGHYGLVGTGPTTGTVDLRFSLFDWWELRTGLLPQPLGLLSRFRIGSVNAPLGAVLVEGGLSGLELGFIAEDDANNAAIRFYVDAGVGYQRALGDRFGVLANLRYRGRYSTVADDGEQLIAGDARLLWDLPGHVSLAGGIAAAYALTDVREPSVAFVEVGQPGLTHFLTRLDGHRESVTVPLSMSYGLSDNFDVDVFITPRVWPNLDAHLGAGLRLRFVDLFGLTGRSHL